MSLRIGNIATSLPITYNPYVAATGKTEAAEDSGVIKNAGASTVKSAGRKSSPAQCQTCAERKYQDGSNEGDVSFKAPTHISPGAAGSLVRFHEQQHVANAYAKEASGNAKVLQASVRIMTAVCPECGRTYVSGGETSTRIQYTNESNPYQKARKKADADLLPGINFDAAV
ncbi:MAG: hypothetical protein K5739_07440 [Lachnospiraceae bacterium]|nr:hypothetical protein [Lachnospiraceae bacterium]